jgi:hypothetical protein
VERNPAYQEQVSCLQVYADKAPLTDFIRTSDTACMNPYAILIRRDTKLWIFPSTMAHLL